jgi:hypothetical protein
MTATQSIDLPGWMAEQLSQASPDLLRATVVWSHTVSEGPQEKIIRTVGRPIHGVRLDALGALCWERSEAVLRGRVKRLVDD